MKLGQPVCIIELTHLVFAVEKGKPVHIMELRQLCQDPDIVFLCFCIVFRVLPFVLYFLGFLGFISVPCVDFFPCLVFWFPVFSYSWVSLVFHFVPDPCVSLPGPGFPSPVIGPHVLHLCLVPHLGLISFCVFNPCPEFSLCPFIVVSCCVFI